MSLNEADTRARLIDPALKRAGWSDSQVTREHFYRRDHIYTAGRIRLRGDRARHGKPYRVDYLLRYTDAFPIAVVEAKAEDEPAVSGLEQAKKYARDMGTAFAYTTNGHEILEYDVFARETRPVEAFPTPADLWQRWQRNTDLSQSGLAVREEGAPYTADRFANPLLYPFAARARTSREPRYYQEVAVIEVIRRLLRGQKRVLLTMATGTGKTFVAFQIVWKLLRSGWLSRLRANRPGRVLFLADRRVLRD